MTFRIHPAVCFCMCVLLCSIPTWPVEAGENLPSGDLRVGYPERGPGMDVLPGFRKPPPGYGEVSFYWWLGDTLTRERMTWQMDQLAGRGVTGLQVNYAHSDSGGFSYGLTYPSQPRLFSEEWWDLFRWFLGEAKKRGMSVSLSDYTLGRAGQGWYVDEILKQDSSLTGGKLSFIGYEVTEGGLFSTELPHPVLTAVAYQTERGAILPGSRVDLSAFVRPGRLQWDPPQGTWKVFVVHRTTVPASLDPMHPRAGAEYVAKFFQRFEDRCPGEAGKGLNFFFSDELDFGIRGFLWNDIFAREFSKRKGYDITPELPALFTDLGPRTPKVRMDYNDVMVALSEENFFKPLYDWHTDRGMIFGCDHGGRGTDVTEFGDYFRTQRWMSGPGCDQPELLRDIVKNKVASSIAHLYERPRTWLEGFHSSNWGTSSARVADAIFANYAMGQNLLSLHGLYYSTHGGWWEWAPPDNHFRQPYWADMTELLRCTERLSYLLSQGVHRCDVAVMYPVATVEAGIQGEAAVQTAFAVGRDLYGRGIDFDFIDFESLARARVEKGELRVSGERYRALILPAMSAVRSSTLEKALAFARAGGVVIAIGALPIASERSGRDDQALASQVKDLFGLSAEDAADSSIKRTVQGPGIFVRDVGHALSEVIRSVPRDYVPLSDTTRPGGVLHRTIGNREIYYVYGVPRGSECLFRAQGKVELWDPWTGSTKTLAVIGADKRGTRLHMPLTECEPQIIVFSPGEPILEKRNVQPVTESLIPLNGEWQFTLRPSLDNTWGDFRLPAYSGFVTAEATTLRYKEETGGKPAWHLPGTDDSSWTNVQVSYGPQFLKLGPFPSDVREVAQRFAQLGSVDPLLPVEVNGKDLFWTSSEFSWRWGVRGDAGHQGYHGLKGVVHDDLMEFGKAVRDWRGAPAPRFEKDAQGNVYYVWTTVHASVPGWASVRKGGIAPTGIWVNNERIGGTVRTVRLYRGTNTLLLRYEGTGRGYFLLAGDTPPAAPVARVPLASAWFNDPAVMHFDPLPDPVRHTGWYRCTAPPGLRTLRFAAHGTVQLWIDGVSVPLVPGAPDPARFPSNDVRVWQAELPVPAARAAVIALRIEHARGYYGGSAIPDPLVFECGPGLIMPGDLSQDRALGTYSGGMQYAREITLTATQAAARKVVLDLGDLVSSARVTVNGRPMGTRSAPPWQFDLTGKVKAGANRIDVLIHNTLGNHYATIPSLYIGSSSSGLIGPAVLRIEE